MNWKLPGCLVGQVQRRRHEMFFSFIGSKILTLNNSCILEQIKLINNRSSISVDLAFGSGSCWYGGTCLEHLGDQRAAVKLLHLLLSQFLHREVHPNWSLRRRGQRRGQTTRPILQTPREWSRIRKVSIPHWAVWTRSTGGLNLWRRGPVGVFWFY